MTHRHSAPDVATDMNQPAVNAAIFSLSKPAAQPLLSATPTSEAADRQLPDMDYVMTISGSNSITTRA